MAGKQSAGILFYRQGAEGLEVLLVHPSGWYNRKAPWSIPKGEPDAGEDLEATARREALEEAGVQAGEVAAIGHITYRKSGKKVYAFIGTLPDGAEPGPASWEVDQVRFMPMEEARRVLREEQVEFLDRLAAYLDEKPRSG